LSSPASPRRALTGTPLQYQHLHTPFWYHYKCAKRMRADKAAVERTKKELRQSFNTFREGLPAEAPMRTARTVPIALSVLSVESLRRGLPSLQPPSRAAAAVAGSSKQQRSGVQKAVPSPAKEPRGQAHNELKLAQSLVAPVPLTRRLWVAPGELAVVGAIVTVVALACLSRFEERGRAGSLSLHVLQTFGARTVFDDAQVDLHPSLCVLMGCVCVQWPSRGGHGLVHALRRRGVP
jgi:hypothetical protein